MAAKGMTANPIRPARYRPGKPVAQETSDEDEYGEDEHQKQSQYDKSTVVDSDAYEPAKKAYSVKHTESDKWAQNINKAHAKADEALLRRAEEEDFVTDESSSENDQANSGSDGRSNGSDSSEDVSSNDGTSSSEDDAPKKFMRPKFVKKSERKVGRIAEQLETRVSRAEENAYNKHKTDALIQERLEQEKVFKSIGLKDWDDDAGLQEDLVNDDDGLDPDAEHAAWKLREFRRLKRERDGIEAAEKEKEEIERRRNLSQAERDAEDDQFLQAQKRTRDERGKMSYMQKYFHKGAFFQDDAKAAGLADRDLMGSRVVDDLSNRDTLPQYMQIRDMAKLGRKGRTKYKDLKTEDTGQWGKYRQENPYTNRFEDGTFNPDRYRDGRRENDANLVPLGQRRSHAGKATKDPVDWQKGRDTEGLGSKGEDLVRNPSEGVRPRSNSRSASPGSEQAKVAHVQGKRKISPYDLEGKRRRIDTP